MNRIGAVVITIAMLVFAGSAQARTHRVHAAEATCPAGAPIQTITVINQADVRPAALALVETRSSRSLSRLRAAWGAPCIVFGPGGWKLYLKTGASGEPWGEHFSNHGLPYLLVWTGALTWQGWSTDFSHEVVETLVDPVNAHYIRDLVSSQLEVADLSSTTPINSVVSTCPISCFRPGTRARKRATATPTQVRSRAPGR
jgi:hypothetical protein